MEPIRVLIVDDNILLCKRITEQLTAKNSAAQIECVGNGAQALSLLKKNKYDIPADGSHLTTSGRIRRARRNAPE